MSLLYEAALLGTVAIVGWIVLDVAADATRRKRLGAVAALAFSVLLWSAGELLLWLVSSPEERIIVRRVLFAGVCALPAAWVWSTLVAARPHEPPSGKLFAALLAPGVIAWSFLFWDRSGLFLDWYAVPSQRGPVFYAFAAYAWALTAAGAVVVLRAAPHRTGV